MTPTYKWTSSGRITRLSSSPTGTPLNPITSATPRKIASPCGDLWVTPCAPTHWPLKPGVHKHATVTHWTSARLHLYVFTSCVRSFCLCLAVMCRRVAGMTAPVIWPCPPSARNQEQRVMGSHSTNSVKMYKSFPVCLCFRSLVFLYIFPSSSP